MALTVSVAVFILQEHSFVRAVDEESSQTDAEAWERALESVPPRERPSVSPCFAAQVISYYVLA